MRAARYRRRASAGQSFACAALGLILALGGCDYRLGYRHFSGPIVPAPGQEARYVVGDDHSITYVRDRLEITLLPLTAEMLNRQFATQSNSPQGFFRPNPYSTPANPYTYGDWKPPGGEQAPARFTIFLLRVKNYAFPKVRIDPENIEIAAGNGRRYQAVNFSALVEYYWPYAVAYAGNAYSLFKERRDLLLRSLFKDDMIFSGQEAEGYVVFPPLEHDVEAFTVWIRQMALRFDYRNEPIETVDIPYQFARKVYFARQLPEEH